MIPREIDAGHVRAAAKRIDRDGVPPDRQSRSFDLLLDAKTYPPKYVVSLASAIATGRPLDSESFGGGVETNTFLRRLGFVIVDKRGAPVDVHPIAEPGRPAGADGPTVRVGRPWLNLGVSQAEFRRTPWAERWAEHRRLVRGQFERDPARYRKRIVDLVHLAGSKGADVVLLPACTLVHGARGVDLKDYDLGGTGLVVAGALDLGRAEPEYALAARGERVLDRFDNQQIRWFDAGGYSVMAVISSTIKRLVEHPDEAPVRSKVAPPNGGPVLLLDIGHHPYSDHYRRHTLRRAAAAAEQRAGHPAAVVLGSWQYGPTKPTPSWCMPESRGTHTRILDDGDLLDLVDVRLG